MSSEPPVIDDALLVDVAEFRRVQEYYQERGWTDGLPVVPVTASYLAEFLAFTARDPDEVLIDMPHLNKALTVRLAAVSAALAGCLPSYFPVVLAAWDAFQRDGMVSRSIWQSTTGTAPFSVLFGPLRTTLGFNSRGNVWGSGFRANATAGRAIRLGAINGLGLKPHEFDQATQGNPAKYSCFIAENEEDSPWPSLAADNGFAASDSRGHLDGHPLGAARRGQAHDRARAAGAGLRRFAVPHRRAGAADRGRVHRAQLRARPDVRQARLVQGRRAAGDRRPRLADVPVTSPRRARRRSPRAPAGGCPPTTRTRSLPNRQLISTRRCGCCSRSTRCRSSSPARRTPGCRPSWRRSASGTGRWRSSRSRRKIVKPMPVSLPGLPPR